MIQLTRLNKQPLVVNSDLIEFIESAPDTVITLLTGEKVIVSESTEDIIERIILFRRRLLPASFATFPSPVVLHRRDATSGDSE